MARFLPFLLILWPTLALAAETLYLAPDLYSAPRASETDASRAAELLDQARLAAEEGRVSQALQLATAALQHSPGEPTCRHVLGYELVEDRWLTAFQKQQVGRGYEWDERYGWVKPSELPRYEAGERRNGRRWISAEQDAARRATIAEGWQVRTDHFVVTTNHSLEAAAKLAAELEAFFQAWRQMFGGYYLSDAELRARFAGERNARRRSRPMQVFYHRDKREYVAALRAKQPRIAETVGIYFDDLKQAHFYFDPEMDPSFQKATLYHEAAHQLFQEITRARKNVGAEANFWLVEAVALYFESLTPAQGPTGGPCFKIGGATAGRMPAARRRLLSESWYVPLAEFAALGRDDLQRQPELAPLYSQAAGLATFLMHADNGARREQLVRGLRKLYSGKTRPGDLERWFDTPLGELDVEYRRYLQSLP